MELEAQMSEPILEYAAPEHVTIPRPSTLQLPSLHSSALEQAQKHLRETREERITDLDAALRKLEEEREK